MELHQTFRFRSYSYPIISSKKYFSKIGGRKRQITVRFCIEATDIVELNAWAASSEDKLEELCITNYYLCDETSEQIWQATETYHGSRAIEFWEEYDRVNRRVLFWCQYTAESISVLNEREAKTLSRLLGQHT